MFASIQSDDLLIFPFLLGKRQVRLDEGVDLFP